MPRKKVEKEPAISPSASQETNSDDFAREIMAAMEEKIRAKNSKKRKETERKFLADVQKELDKSLENSEKILETLTLRRNQVLDKFELDHATSDDTIRKIRAKMVAEQRGMIEAITKEREEINDMTSEIEQMQFRALAKVARGCQEDYETALKCLEIM